MITQPFGGPSPTATQQTGAYGIARNRAGEILLVEDRGRFYLPGGRLEPDETPQQALAREIREECGCVAVPGAPMGEALQPIFGGKVLLLATYWSIDLGRPLDEQPEHRSLWSDLERAAELVHRASDRAVLARLIAR